MKYSDKLKVIEDRLTLLWSVLETPNASLDTKVKTIYLLAEATALVTAQGNGLLWSDVAKIYEKVTGINPRTELL